MDLMDRPDTVRLLNVRIDRVNLEKVRQFCRQALSGTGGKQIVTLNGEIALKAARLPALAAVINRADLVVADSTNVLWASYYLGRPLPGRIPGVDLVKELAQLLSSTGGSVYLLGSRDDVAKQAALALKKQFPNLHLAGFSSANPDDESVASQIRRSGADLVLVAYGSPTQELWIDQYGPETGAKLLVGVGGTFDMLAGRLRRAPRSWRVLHLEWLWRLILEPRRLGRIFQAVVVFPLKVIVGR